MNSVSKISVKERKCISLMELIPIASYDPEKHGSVWDIVKKYKMREEDDEMNYYLTSRCDDLQFLLEAIKNFGKPYVKKGRMSGYSLQLPFVGPTEHISQMGQALGVFAKIYTKPKMFWRCQKEFDCTTYIGSLPVKQPNLISINNWPKPRIFENRLLLLPLVLSTKELKKLCVYKTRFYRKYFSFEIDLQHVYPQNVASPLASTDLLVNDYVLFLLTMLLWRQSNRFEFLHPDAIVDRNILRENLHSLVHRLTGSWPLEPVTGVQFVTATDSYDSGCALTIRTPAEFPVLIDYDTTYYSGQKEYDDMSYYNLYTETMHLCKSMNDNELCEYYQNQVHNVLPLITKTALERVTGLRKNCCTNYCKNHPFLVKDIKRNFCSNSCSEPFEPGQHQKNNINHNYTFCDLHKFFYKRGHEKINTNDPSPNVREERKTKEMLCFLSQMNERVACVLEMYNRVVERPDMRLQDCVALYVELKRRLVVPLQLDCADAVNSLTTIYVE